MEIYERINDIIKEQGLTKREFAQRLISLEPKLRTTGETPTEKTIYKYLNGTIAIRIELLSFIAEALNVTEQELFFTSKKEQIHFFRKMVQNANDEELEILKKRLLSRYELENIGKSYIAEISPPHKQNAQQQKLIALLPYAPQPLMDALLVKLEELRAYTDSLDKL